MNTRGLQVREVRATHAQLRGLAARRPRQFPVLFDIAAPGVLSRYSILAALPRASLVLRGDGRLEQHGVRLGAGTFLGALDEWWRAEHEPADLSGLPFRGGWVVFLGYELAASIETGLRLPPLARDAVCAAAIRVGGALVYDHAQQRCQLVAEAQAGDDLPEIAAALSDRDEPEAGRPAAAYAPGAIIDLERNDLGRICEAGSVEVNEFMVTESYPNLHHIVSNVRGRLRRGTTPGDTLRAVFPGGTITGCPKYRCMQIIAELEDGPRGAYTGSLWYLNRDGDMDFNILIRTATLRGGELQFRAGAGIVADSDWQRELAETRSKARGMLRAFGAGEGANGAGA